MPRRTKSVRLYRKHQASGQAIVTLNGRDHYLGPHGSQASRIKYDRLIAEWLVNSRPPGAGPCADPTIDELILGYWKHAETYYIKVGKATSELGNVKVALCYLRRLYGQTRSSELGPRALEAVRQTRIDAGLIRKSINRRVGRIKQAFKWGTENELVQAQFYDALRSVTGLNKGRSDAREGEPVKPVDDRLVDAVRPQLSRTTANRQPV